MKAPLNEAAVPPPIAASEAAPEVLGLEFSRNLGHISRQSAVFFLGTLFTMGAGYLVKVYVARVLGAEQLGLYALGMTMVSLVQVAGMLGLQGTAPRFVAVYNATGVRIRRTPMTPDVVLAALRATAPAKEMA